MTLGCGFWISTMPHVWVRAAFWKGTTVIEKNSVGTGCFVIVFLEKHRFDWICAWFKRNLKIAWGTVDFSLAYKIGAGDDNEERNLKTNNFSCSNWPSESIIIMMQTDWSSCMLKFGVSYRVAVYSNCRPPVLNVNASIKKKIFNSRLE